MRTIHAVGTWEAPMFVAHVGAPPIPFVCDCCASDAVVDVDGSMLCATHHKELLLRRKGQ